MTEDLVFETKEKSACFKNILDFQRPVTVFLKGDFGSSLEEHSFFSTVFADFQFF